MTEVMKPISDKEYEEYYSEMYSVDGNGRTVCPFIVKLDPDPSVNPYKISEKVALVQSMKERLLVIYNLSIRNKAYWEDRLKALDACIESEKSSAMLTDEVKSGGNAERRMAMATEISKKSVIEKYFPDNGETFDKIYQGLTSKLAEAFAFFMEVRNIYEALDKTSMGLAIQQKSVLSGVRGNVGAKEEPWQ